MLRSEFKIIQILNLAKAPRHNAPFRVQANSNFEFSKGAKDRQVKISILRFRSVDFAIESEQIPDFYAFHMGSGITSSYSYSNKAIEPAHFLDTCRLCNRRLGHGRDIYMYR
jgi:hypothetical protein